MRKPIEWHGMVPPKSLLNTDAKVLMSIRVGEHMSIMGISKKARR
ncbi:hypothetical protein [Marinomonas gallaica]|nr:hypothetical protein [Marinomonas gallaica]